MNNIYNNINYQKRKNIDLFNTLEKPENLFLSKTQNYIPIYSRFFSLNESNYNSINLNNKWYLFNINNIINTNSETKKLFNCIIKNVENEETKNKNIFIKLAPLLDPFKYLVGKYNSVDENKLYNLPNLESINNKETNYHNKILDTNNAAYVDGFFVYLTSILKNKYKFNHGLDYYGSFLAIKNNYVINVFDDLDYLTNSEFFNKNKNLLFKIDNYEHLIKNEKQKLKTIKIDYCSSVKSLSFKSINNEVYENIFNDDNDYKRESKIELELITDVTNNDDDNNITTIRSKSNSSCSSRVSYTNSDFSDFSDINDVNDVNECDSEYKSISDWEDMNSEIENESKKNIVSENESDDYNEDEDEDEEEINVTISKFPVQLICMENCENTLDDLILNNDLTTDEWLSALMQIIMILITYQKVFSFTHNDLHTNNIMYNQTSKKFITYYFNKKLYKIPTF